MLEKVGKFLFKSLGPGDHAFGPHYSDQKPSEIVDFRGLFLFLVYCGAKGECIYILSFKATLDKIYITYPFLRTIPAKLLISIHDYTLYARG